MNNPFVEGVEAHVEINEEKLLDRYGEEVVLDDNSVALLMSDYGFHFLNTDDDFIKGYIDQEVKSQPTFIWNVDAQDAGYTAQTVGQILYSVTAAFVISYDRLETIRKEAPEIRFAWYRGKVRKIADEWAWIES